MATRQTTTAASTTQSKAPPSRASGRVAASCSVMSRQAMVPAYPFH